MLSTEECKKIMEAFDLLDSHGIYMCVPGWFDLADSEDAIEFIQNPDIFYEKRNTDFQRS